MENNSNSNKKVSIQKQYVEDKNGDKKTFVSEVQEFDKPEDYDGAFKEYYPEQNLE